MDEEKRDDEEFYSLCRSYLTMKPALSSIEESTNIFTVGRITDETIAKMEIGTVR